MSTFENEELLHTIYMRHLHPTHQATANAMGISEAGVRRRLTEAVRRGLTDETFGSIPEGYRLGKITRLVNVDGKSLEWQHLHPDEDQVQRTLDLIESTLNSNIKPLPLIQPPSSSEACILAAYPDADFHYGMYAWGRETGESYDLNIAEELFKSTTQRLFSMMPRAEIGLIVELGDGMHADNNSNRTERSGAQLDVDSRHEKVLHGAIELADWKIQLALQRHQHVIYKRLKGNHDPYSAVAVTAALYFRYKDNPRVTINREPGEFFFYKFGKNMIGAHHGHLVPPSEMPGVMAAYQPEMWGATTHRYAWLGHFHRRRKGQAMQDEAGGAVWEVFQTIAPKDAWSRSMGHSSNRSLTGIVFDREGGESMRIPVNIRRL